MKKYLKELIILFFQLFMFYVFPVFAGPTDAMGMVFLILVSVLVLSLVMGIVSKEKLKYLYPVVVAVAFIPSVFIWYNESAMVHSLWYLVVSSVGLFSGVIIRKI